MVSLKVLVLCNEICNRLVREWIHLLGKHAFQVS